MCYLSSFFSIAFLYSFLLFVLLYFYYIFRFSGTHTFIILYCPFRIKSFYIAFLYSFLLFVLLYFYYIFRFSVFKYKDPTFWTSLYFLRNYKSDRRLNNFINYDRISAEIITQNKSYFYFLIQKYPV